MTDEELIKFRSLAQQMDTLIEGFMGSFAQPFFAHSQVLHAVRQVAEIRGRTDIVQRVDDLNASKPR